MGVVIYLFYEARLIGFGVEYEYSKCYFSEDIVVFIIYFFNFYSFVYKFFMFSLRSCFIDYSDFGNNRVGF